MSDRKLMSKIKIKYKYSGDESKKFWDTINRVKNPKGSEAYALGCVLQNIEEDIIDKINMIIGEGEK